MSKVRVGIDINEVLRAKWVQFDKYYVEEFGEENAPKENQYIYDYFNSGYRWEDKVEVIKELKEPGEMPENISPLDYQHDEKLGDAPADAFLFKKPEEIKLAAREVYNRFMYEDYCFELHASAPEMYKGMSIHVNNFYLKYGKTAEFTLLSIENRFSIPPTLFFLSRISSRFKNYRFVEESHQMWDDIDVLITSDPELLKMGAPWGRKLIKIIRPYNENIHVGSQIEVLQIAELIDNPDFEKIIKFKKQIK